MRRNSQKIVTIRPAPLKEHIDKLLAYAEGKDDLIETVKLIRKHYIDPANLVRIQTFAHLYGTQKLGKGRPVNRQYIYELIEKGKLPEIVIDDAIFVDKTLL